MICDVMISWLEDEFDLNNVIMIHDWPPCHGTKVTAFLAKKVLHFVPTKIWRSSSPDLNILDYFLLGVLQ